MLLSKASLTTALEPSPRTLPTRYFFATEAGYICLNLTSLMNRNTSKSICNMDIVSVVLADCCVAYCLHCVHGSESYHYLPVVILAIKAITKIKGIIAIKAITSI